MARRTTVTMKMRILALMLALGESHGGEVGAQVLSEPKSENVDEKTCYFLLILFEFNLGLGNGGNIQIRKPRNVTSVIGWLLSLQLRSPDCGSAMFDELGGHGGSYTMDNVQIDGVGEWDISWY
jgi:hypothetical protein